MLQKDDHIFSVHVLNPREDMGLPDNYEAEQRSNHVMDENSSVEKSETEKSEKGEYLTLWKIDIWMSKNGQKLAIFFQKKFAKNCHFFNKIAKSNFVENKTIFGILKKNSSFWQFFDIQMAIFRRVSWEWNRPQLFFY